MIYAGLGISYLWSSVDTADGFGVTTWNVPLYLGVSWHIGPGSLDFGTQISENNTIFMIGYTFSPSVLNLKK